LTLNEYNHQHSCTCENKAGKQGIGERRGVSVYSLQLKSILERIYKSEFIANISKS